MILVAVPFYILLVWFSPATGFVFWWFLLAAGFDFAATSHYKDSVKNAYYHGKDDAKGKRRRWDDE